MCGEEFFSQCYHLKDWLKKEHPHLGTAIETHITNSPGLSLAADYTNTFKHAGLDKPPRSKKQIQKIIQGTSMMLTPMGFVATAKLLITVDGVQHDAFTIATDCTREWDTFFKANGITMPPR